MSIEKLVRKEVLNFEPYIPGKPIEELKRELKIKGEIIKLASNENPIGPSQEVIKAIKESAKNVFLYPDGSCFNLRKLLAKKHDITPQEIILGSGTDELIELIGKTFFNPEDEIIVSEHAFIRYKMAGELMGCKVISVPMKNFKHDLESMAKAVTSKTKAIFIANPNNPTGTYNTKSEVENFLNSLLTVHSSLLTIFDEAYYEYARVERDYPETINFYRKYKNLIILRTFSKIHSLAGLRIGYAIANSEIVSYIDRIRPPFNVNSIAQVAAEIALKDTKNIRNSLKMVEEGKKYLYSELKKIGLKFIPSAANFILIDVSPNKGYDVFQSLLKLGIIVRAMNEYDFPNHIRVTVGKPEENKKFIEGLRKVLK
ncbi:MAG: histidinol-phosphate transaminase [Endomicrobiia bacterium]